MFNGITKEGIKVNIEDSRAKLDYFCPLCKAPLIRKTGEINIHHFAHTKRASCDPWYSGMSEWHRKWQSIFPQEKQEIILSYLNRKHILDVCLNDIVIEFQHSPISKEELKERNEFYLSTKGKVIWILDCFGKHIIKVSLRRKYIYYSRITAHETMETNSMQQFEWRHRKRVFDTLTLNENLSLYLHVNEFYVIKVTQLNSLTGLYHFSGIPLTIDDFLSELGQYDKGEIHLSKDKFYGYSEKFRRQFDVDEYCSWIRKNGKISKYSRVLFNKYINLKIDYEELLSSLNLNYTRPSNNNSYFYGMKNN